MTPVRVVTLADPLTPMETRVRDLVVEGRTSLEIAEQLRVGLRTIEYHRLVVMRKMGARNVADVVRMTLEHRSPPSAESVVWEQPYDTVL